MSKTYEYWTVDAWLQQYGEVYGISLTNKRYVQRCCAGETMRSTNGYEYVAHLPNGWTATKIPAGRGSWLIHRDDPTAKKKFWTTDEWLNEFGEVYKLSSRAYLINCCAGNTIKLADGREYTCYMPPGWTALKIPGGKGPWIIYETDDDLVFHIEPIQPTIPAKRKKRSRQKVSV